MFKGTHLNGNLNNALTHPTSDLGYVDCEVSSEANNHVAIPNAPSSKDGYIPVIIHHTSSNNVLDHVFYDSGYWRIYSTLTQRVIVRFYKYPV